MREETTKYEGEKEDQFRKCVNNLATEDTHRKLS